ncbi:MAG TPA: rRNA maturation RNase YbeY [Chthonomonadales bacterium]|nr:rRNA maturation RNase YbeY [Chthonomonadales bacterium]
MNLDLLNTTGRNLPTERMVRAVSRLLESMGRDDAELCIVLVDDTTMQELNNRHRAQDKSTDVLSFSQRESLPGAPSVHSPPGAPELLGDVVVSLETAERQAQAAGHSLEHELALLGVHGALHLLGNEDDSEEGAEAMRLQQDRILTDIR